MEHEMWTDQRWIIGDTHNTILYRDCTYEFELDIIQYRTTKKALNELVLV